MNKGPQIETFVFDSWAVIAWLQGEPQGEVAFVAEDGGRRQETGVRGQEKIYRFPASCLLPEKFST